MVWNQGIVSLELGSWTAPLTSELSRTFAPIVPRFGCPVSVGGGGTPDLDHRPLPYLVFVGTSGGG